MERDELLRIVRECVENHWGEREEPTLDDLSLYADTVWLPLMSRKRAPGFVEIPGRQHPERIRFSPLIRQRANMPVQEQAKEWNRGMTRFFTQSVILPRVIAEVCGGINPEARLKKEVESALEQHIHYQFRKTQQTDQQKLQARLDAKMYQRRRKVRRTIILFQPSPNN